MTVYSRKRRRRETISFTAECARALSGVLALATLFFAMLGFMPVSASIWFFAGALAASFISRSFDDEQKAARNYAGSRTDTATPA